MQKSHYRLQKTVMPFYSIKIIVPANHREGRINAFCSLLSFCYQIEGFQAENPLFMRIFESYDLFPLHRAGGFGSDVIDHAVHMFHLVGDAVADGG